MVDVKVGETVKVIEYPGGRVANAVVRDATVIKVARVWISVQIHDSLWNQEQRFRRDSQTDGSPYSLASRFWTLEQWAAKEKLDAALALLREQGIDIRHESPWKDREVDLAAMLRLYLHSESQV